MCLLFIWIGFISTLSATTQLVIEPEDGLSPLLHDINSARNTIDIVSYGITSKKIVNEIIRESHSKKIRVLLEKSPYKQERQNEPAFELFQKNQIPYQNSLPNIRYIHQKTLIFDGKKAWIMTFNLTASAFKKQRNFALITDDSSVVQAMQNQFNSDWNQTITRQIDYPFLLSPVDARKKILALIKSAKNNIRIYAQDIQDDQILNLLIQKSQSGVRIQILSNRPHNFSDFKKLSQAGIRIHYPNLYIHAKVMIIDGKKALIGSMNLTKNSLDGNRELGIITEDGKVIKKLNSTFDHDLNDRQSKIGKNELFYSEAHTRHTQAHPLEILFKRMVKKFYQYVYSR